MRERENMKKRKRVSMFFHRKETRKWWGRDKSKYIKSWKWQQAKARREWVEGRRNEGRRQNRNDLNGKPPNLKERNLQVPFWNRAHWSGPSRFINFFINIQCCLPLSLSLVFASFHCFKADVPRVKINHQEASWLASPRLPRRQDKTLGEF
jgi:hypothetical protein